MMQLRKAESRGAVDHGWLDARHSFSFGYYDDPRWRGFRDLVVLNEDRIEPGRGFGKHAHHDMEIVTYPIAGKLRHGDSIGEGSTLVPGDVQRMSAGRGVVHSEFNASDSEPLHLLQIWLTPERAGLDPGYEEKHFSRDDKRNRLLPIVGSADGALAIHQDATIYASVLEAGKQVEHRFTDGRHGWIQLIHGTVEANGETLTAGDGAALGDVTSLAIEAKQEAEFLLFDLR